MTPNQTRDHPLAPYASRVSLRWLAEEPEGRIRTVDGTLVFADVSGFTPLTEKLARRGKVGAEELTDVLNDVFGTLGRVTDEFGGDLLKFGGDAMLLLFDGDEHVERAAACALGLLNALRRFKRLKTAGGVVSLSMSIGLEAGPVHLLHVGSSHRELFALGPVVSMTVGMENAAQGGQVLVGPAAARALDAKLLGESIDEGRVLLAAPDGVARPDLRPIDTTVAPATLAAPLAAHLGGGREDGEHRVASLAFMQFKGTDDLLEAAGLEAVASAVDEVVRTAQRACEERDVTFLATDVDKNGGKVLFVTGAPKTGVHDEDRMLLALRDSVVVNGALQVRAGANRGRAFAVDVGSATRRTYAVMGDATNLAARVMGKAEPGTVVATRALVDHLHNAFAITELDPFMVKGKSMPISAGVVGEPLGSRLDVASALPFVGRQAERQLLRSALVATAAGEGEAYVVIGEPGLGKSRLIVELVADAADRRVVTIEGGRYAAATPYFALRAPLRTLIGAERDAPAGVVAERLTMTVERLLPEARVWLPLLAPLVGAELPDTPEVRALDGGRRRTVTDAYAIRLLQTMHEPTLVIVEDAHWLDDATAALMDRLVAGIAKRPWLICVSRRPVDEGWIPGVDPDRTIRLQPLGEDESVALLRAVASTRSLSPHARAAVASRGAGNPLFLRELLESVDAAGEIPDLPDTVEGVIASGIDELDRRDRDALRIASVLGGQPTRSVLARMLDVKSRELDAVLDRLQRFLVPATAEMLRFSHALIRDVAYESLPFRRRRALHARAGEILQASTADPEALADLLALHFHAAEAHVQTWRHARIAGDRARRNAAAVEAARFYRWALHAAASLRELPSEEVASVAEALGEMLELSGLYDEAARTFARARKLVADDPLRTGQLLKKEGWVRERSGRYSAALGWYTRALKSIPEQRTRDDETERLRTQLVMSMGAARARQGRYAESLPYLLQAADHAEELGDLPTLAHAYYLLDWAMTDLGHPDAARYREKALPIYERLDDLAGQTRAYNNLGIDAYYEGRWDEARGHYEKSRGLARRIGEVVQEVTEDNNIGEILSDQGHLSEARRIFEESVATCRSVNFPVGGALALSNLGRIAAREGRYDDAAALFNEARDEFQRIGADAFVVEVDSRRAEMLLFAGNAQDAITLADAAATKAVTLGGLPVVIAMLDRVIGVAFALTGDAATSRLRLEASRARALESGADYELAQTLWAIATVTPNRDEAEAASIAAVSIFDRLGVVDVDAVSVARVLRPITIPEQRAAVD